MSVSVSACFFAISQALLNTSFELVGFECLKSIGRAYVSLMFLVNLGVLQVICRLAARGETEPAEIVYAGLAIQFCEFILSAIAGRFLGVFSILPIFLVTVFLFTKLSSMSHRSALKVTLVYYAYHALSLLLARWIAAKLR